MDKGTNASYLWKSLLERSKLLNKGLIYRVGRGNDISIWNDLWKPVTTTFKVAQHKKHLWPDGKVNDLIENDFGRWKLNIINAYS